MGSLGSDSPSEYWRQVEDLFHEALTIPADARSQFLHERSHGNAALEREVAGIVKSYQEQDALGLSDSTPRGRRYGSYEVVSKLGSGGMGDVYRRAAGRISTSASPSK